MLPAPLRLLRPHDWIKNAIVLLPVVFVLAPRAGGTDVPADRADVIVPAMLAFAAFCLVASGFYALNDIVDAPDDRRHPLKRQRPVAAGAIGSSSALAIGIVLAAAGIALGYHVNNGLAALLLAFAGLQGVYTGCLKRIPHVDVMAVATGYGMRAAGGAAAVGVPLSVWLVLCIFFLGLYIGFLKRLCDVTSAGDADWRPGKGYADRGELTWLLGVTAALAVLAYLMYALSGHASALFGVRSRGFALLSPLVLIAIHRFYRRAARGESDTPMAALLHDRAAQVAVVVFVAGVFVTLYVPAVETVLGRLFVAEVAGAGP